jgi:broad specificity phosphatase PhoE
VAPSGPAAWLRGLLLLALAFAGAASADEALWGELQAGGLVVFIRHGLTDPGVGDPPGFKLGDCKTERNLNAEGRAESLRLGEAFQRRRIPVAQVLSSEWCRCRDTAELAFGRYKTWNALNNLFGRPENAESQKRAMLDRASRFQGPGNLILVSHGATIVTVAGVSPAPAEMVVMRPAGAGKLEFVGRMPAPPG